MEEHTIKLDATPETIKPGWLRMAMTPIMGARPLKRIIQQRVEDPLSDALLAGDLPMATPSWWM